MSSLLNSLSTFGDFLLVAIGFGFIIFIHELGHFLAARWAGIRVLAFAIGFGPPVLTWRKGIGLRRGSSEQEYLAMAGVEGVRVDPAVSPTEYRLNWLPLGGYVKMLGQDDLDPTAVSAAPDSYQRCKPWKRMIVISAGVVMNVILAAVLFVIVFSIGLKTEPAAIGEVAPGSAAAGAVALNAARLGITEPGLHPGDEILTIDGNKPHSFNDLVLATAMAERTRAVMLEVRRPGIAEPVQFAVVPEESPLSKLLDIGVDPPRSTSIPEIRDPSEREEAIKVLAKIGLAGVKPGMSLVRVGEDGHVTGAEALTHAAAASHGRPFEVEFATASEHAAATLTPKAELEADKVSTGPSKVATHNHLLGLTPVMKIADAAPESKSSVAKDQGLRDNDVFVRLGPVEYPSVTEGISTIQQFAGRQLEVVVERSNDAGAVEHVTLTVSVGRDGRIGFSAGDTSNESVLLALPPRQLESLTRKGEVHTPPASGVIERPGTRIVAVGSNPVGNFTQLRAALVAATLNASEAGSGASVPLEVLLPIGTTRGDAKIAPTERLVLTLSREDVRRLHALTWTSPISTAMFSLKETTLKAEGVVDALRMGAAETHRVMMTTYLTFARLAQGTVKVEHLKGPVGIAHLGTRVAERGMVWLLFFMAMISVNLAVINFLPLPIVDGGQFLFLLFEQFRGKPVPIKFQNAATIAGLVLIGSMFLIVTFNDVMGFFTR